MVMTSSGSLNEQENPIKQDFSKAKVVEIFSHFKSSNKALRKQSVSEPKLFNAKIEDLKAMQ
jgi:hypothetical protein